jgi:ketosteroid isomerase-like protein
MGWTMPCTDWDVRALVNHVVAEERWTIPLMSGQTIEDVGSTLDGDLLGDNPADAATHAAHAAQLAVTEPVLTGATVLGDRAVVRWRFSWLDPDGWRGHVRGVDVLRLRDGRVAEKLSYVKG